MHIGHVAKAATAHRELKTEMSPVQAKSAQVLLSKAVPDESRVEQVMDDASSLSRQENDEALQRLLI